MKFIKMHGLGNDYVYINALKKNIANPEQLAIQVSNRNFGIGADGLVLILPSEVCDFKMRMFNADGSEAEMCGNAIRCVGKYVYDYKFTNKKDLTIETLAGIKKLNLNTEGSLVISVTVDMGEPILIPKDIPAVYNKDSIVSVPLEIDGTIYLVTSVSVGNPHCVVFVDDVENIDINKIGPIFENHPMFPKKVNTEFVKVISKDTIELRVWERGSGETLACGTGSCASLVACVLNSLTNRSVTVKLGCGELFIDWNEDNNHIYMTGPAVISFTGKLHK